MTDNIIRNLDAARRAKALTSRAIVDRAHMEPILAHLTKELSWEAYRMLRDGKVLSPRADHDEAMSFSTTVAEALSIHFRDMVDELYG